MLSTHKPCTNTIDSNSCMNKPNINFLDMPTANEYNPMTSRRKENSNTLPVMDPGWILDQDVSDCWQLDENIQSAATENDDSDDDLLYNETLMPRTDNNERSVFEQLITQYNAANDQTETIDELIDVLETLYSGNTEKLLICCLLKHIFSNYKSLSALPKKDILLMAKLCGGILGRGLNSLHCPKCWNHCDIMKIQQCFIFTALNRFKNCLKSNTMFCSRIRRNPHFINFPTQLMKDIGLHKLRKYIEC